MHLIEKHVPNDLELDKVQRQWLCKIMQDTFEEPVAKSIVKAHLDDMDTRAMWKEITQCHEYSTTSTISSQKLSSYIASVRLEDGRWRGTQCNFIVHFKEQLRQHNDTSAHPYADGQMVQ